MDAAETNTSQRPCTERQISEHIMDDKDSTTY